MNKIKRLSQEQASKIAAGEVIDRPAHVVKELLENALDAGATAITLYVEKSGKRLIRVVDNGCGMSADDAQLCFAHHATSKISAVEDLEQLATFGFRGEALASIAAVSTVTLLTKQTNDAVGVQVMHTEHEMLLVTEKACNTGTDITITDLFENMPVRKKFLRTDETEWSQIQQLLYAMALSHQQVHFKVYVDSKLRYNCPVAPSIRVRLEQLWGYELYTLHTIDVHHEGIRIEGVITDTHHLRYDRSHMYLFVNNRWIKNQSLVRAWLKGYQNILPAGKYPAGVLHITLNPAVIDVNIHPRKEEILFLSPRAVEQYITQTIKDTLQKGMQEQLKKAQETNRYPEITHRVQQPVETAMSMQISAYQLPPLTKIVESSLPMSPMPLAKVEENPVQIVENQLSASAVDANYTIIGQFNTTYILLDTQEALLMMDQHAAHERILYEQCKSNTTSMLSMSLLFPPLLHLSESDIQKLEPYFLLFHQQAIELRVLGSNQLQVLSCPIIGKAIDWQDLIKQVIAWINEYEHLSVQEMQDQLLHALWAQIACKAAVKAGDILTQEQMQQLVKDLYRCPDHLTCPHGRPTCWLLAENEIKKKFKRDYKS